MSHDRLLVLDIETIPDRTLLPAPDPLLMDKPPFPKTLHHRIVAISFLTAAIARIDGVERYEIEQCRSGGALDAGEADLLRGLWSLIERDKPRVVTWNGRGFDLPVLAQRALMHGVPMHYWHQAGDRWNTYRQRYAPDWSCDLMDVLGEYGAAPRLNLHETAVAVGLPGKLISEGSQIEELFAKGEIATIRAYCETDVLNLAGLYLRWAYVAGRTDAVGYELAVNGVMQLLERERLLRPHLGLFLDRWRATQRPIHVPPASAAGREAS